ncbi:uncharacterized protein LOC117573468 [Drosophila albomicans]|uniref:Uncharacterized protein LOC117573468 n=1 Tax=Drosophila albomicans TaxID=7291 RepID=A0A9C6WKJ7_DROAB|nr:uncharacterized protein LOC117573468 [Drosophila albomicans]
MCLTNVRDWLVLLTMEFYLDRFKESGYNSIGMCKQIMYSDLIMLGIENLAHRQLLLDGVQLLQNSKEFPICSEPCQQHINTPDPLTIDIDCHLEESMETMIKEHYAALLSPPIVPKQKKKRAKETKGNYASPLTPTAIAMKKLCLDDNDNFTFEEAICINIEPDFNLLSTAQRPGGLKTDK